jgi:hypothetical protein
VQLELRPVCPVRGREQRPGNWPPDARLQRVEVGIAALLARRGEHHALARPSHRREQRLDLIALGEAARDRLPVDAAVREGEAVENPAAPASSASRTSWHMRSISAAVAARS